MPPNPYVDLGVVKTVSDQVVAPGATLTWTLVATNHGPGTSTGFVLADELPAGVTFVSHTADAPLTCTTPAPGAGGVVRCTAPSVPAAPAAGFLAHRHHHRHRARRDRERHACCATWSPSTATSPNRSRTRTPTATSR